MREKNKAEIEKLQADAIGALVVSELKNIEHLECDGSVRVLHYVLSKKDVPHYVFQGVVELNGKIIPHHFWIGLPDGRLMDFKARMWLGSHAPNGVFHEEETDAHYEGRIVEMTVPDFMYRLLIAKF